MSNRLLTYAIVISIAIHVVILGVIGKTSAAKPIDLESLKLVKVDLVKTPDDIKLASAQQPKPEPQDSAEPAPYVPPIKQMKAAPPPSPKAVARVAKAMIKPGPLNPANRTVSHSPPGNPGGALNLGSTSSHGENLGSSSGTSNVGYVPNNNGGSGVGSGTGAGVGTPDPPKNADDGPGLTPSPALPPPPRMIEMTVCAVSGLKPGKYCEKKTSKNFREDDTPSRICDVCKEPEFVSRLADRAEPELTGDSKVRIPDSVLEEGIDTTVKIQYTVDADGGVSDVKVTGSSGNRELDRAVVDAARKMKYKPAVQDGIPRAVKKTRTYKIRV